MRCLDTMKITRGAVRIVEVGPRDGLQTIKDQVPTTVKLELIRRLKQTGLRTIELTSVVSPRAVPQLADCRGVLGDTDIKQLQEVPGYRFPVLVPNLKGLDIALECGVKEVAVFVSATEGFSKANINCSVDVGIQRARSVAEKALHNGVVVRGYVSCIFADPFDGPTDPSAVLHCVKELLGMGCYEISLGDTLGVGCPTTVRDLLNYLVENSVPVEQLAGHFHDTYGHAAANAWEAYLCGVRAFDSSVGGLGGCPYAPGSKGNVASEDLVFMFHNAGVDTGVDLLKLVETGAWVSRTLPTDTDCTSGISSPTKCSTFSNISNSLPQWSLLQKRGKIGLYRAGSSVKIVLGRAKHGNTLTHRMILEMIHVIEKWHLDDTITTVVITGDGRFFCMGVEYGGEDRLSGDVPELESLTRLLDLVGHSPKTTIASINGPAFGGGVCLALACDIRVSVRTATLTMGEAIWTLPEDDIKPLRQGVQKATILARPITATKLKSMGIVSDVLDGNRRMEECVDRMLPLQASLVDQNRADFAHTKPIGGGNLESLVPRVERRVSSKEKTHTRHRRSWMTLVTRIWGSEM